MRCVTLEVLVGLALLSAAAGAAPTTRSWEDFGDIASPQAGDQALQKALDQIIGEGGGVLVTPAGALSGVGINFAGDVMDTAIAFRQPNGHVQPIRVGSSMIRCATTWSGRAA